MKTINLSGNTALPSPIPDGWSRINDTDGNMGSSGMYRMNDSAHYNGDYNANYGSSSSPTFWVRFNFTGDRIRLFGRIRGACNLTITLDSINYNITNYDVQKFTTSLFFEALDIGNLEHSLYISGYCTMGFQFEFDCMDVAAGATTKPYKSKFYNSYVLNRTYSPGMVKPLGHDGMTVLSTHNDDSTVSLPSLGFDLCLNSWNCRSGMGVSGNSWIGMPNIAEIIKINDQDSSANNIYYKKNDDNFVIRYEGNTDYDGWGKNDKVWEVTLYADGVIQIIVEAIVTTTNTACMGTAFTPVVGISYVFFPTDISNTTYTMKQGSYILSGGSAEVVSTAYSVSELTNNAGTITHVPYGCTKSAFLANLTPSEQGQTWNSNNISDPVASGNTLVVTSKNGVNTATYTISVDGDTKITSKTYLVTYDDPKLAGNIANIVEGTTKANFLKNLVKDDEAQTIDASGVSAYTLYTDKLIVTAKDGVSKRTYSLSVTEPTNKKLLNKGVAVGEQMHQHATTTLHKPLYTTSGKLSAFSPSFKKGLIYGLIDALKFRKTWTPPSDWIDISKDVPVDGLVMLLNDTSSYTFQINTCYAEENFSWDGADHYTITKCGSATVDWGDGTVETLSDFNTTLATHTYAAGTGKACSRGYTTFKMKVTATEGFLVRCQLHKTPNTDFTTTSTAGILWAIVGTGLMRDISYMFVYREQANTNEISCPDLEYFMCEDLSKVVFAEATFHSCKGLLECIVNNLSLAPSTEAMFRDCEKLSSLYISNTINVKKMVDMFENCKALTQDCLTALNTSNVTDMSAMFRWCDSLQTIPKFDTSKCTNMVWMFLDCHALLHIPLLDTSKVVAMDSMFSGCYYLDSIPDFDLSSCTSMKAFVYSCCNSLKTVTLHNTQNVEDMSGAFSDCYKLTSFNMEHMEKLKSIDFSNCTLLRTLIITGGVWDGPAPQISVSYSGLQSLGLTNLYKSLPTVTNGAQINVAYAEGAGSADKTIATNKGWTVVTTI